ncbi:MAG: sigma-70 family RNA polymerase sigma factor, partial [Calditrichaceae bacterium]
KKETAEEISQDVFVKVYQKINTYEYKAKFSTWLFTIVYRTALNYLNKKQILVSASDYTDSDNNDIPLEKIHHDAGMYNLHDGPDYQRQQIIYKAIDKLEMKQGIIMSLFYLKEFTINEIAQIMDLSVNTIKTHLFRGRENLRKMLLKQYAPEDLI